MAKYICDRWADNHDRVVLTAENESLRSLVDDLKQHVRTHLAKYEYLRDIEFVDDCRKPVAGKFEGVHSKSANR